MKKTKILFGVVIALIVVMPSFSPLSSKSLALREGAYVKWSVELKALDRSKGQTEHYWSAESYLKIFKITNSSDGMAVLFAYSTHYFDVAKGTYSESDKSPRVSEGMYVNNGSTKAVFSNGNNYEYVLHKESWMFMMEFPFSPFTIFNVKKADFKDWFCDAYLYRVIGSRKRECGIFFETWDIVLGSRRKIYYAEMYYLSSSINLGESEIPESSVIEINVGIDRESGIIAKLRYFWQYSQNIMFELILSIKDTNVFKKGTFINGVIITIIGLIAAYMAYRFYKKKKRLKKIRI